MYRNLNDGAFISLSPFVSVCFLYLFLFLGGFSFNGMQHFFKHGKLFLAEFYNEV